ncbi:MAG: hypothetical protein IKQ43_07540 [Treponema sp.]|nr:hypothetical protein [Treponema sp.]MBR7080628.1 hypothetical protein [Treponema sp.]
MKIKRLLDKLLENWPAKVICLALALLLYFFYNLSLLDKKTFTLLVSTVENGQMTSATDKNAIKSVKVTVHAKQEQLAGINEDDLKAYIDISSQTAEGTFDFPVLIETSPRLKLMDPLEITSVPENIKTSVEEKKFKYLPVKTSLVGTPARGYEVLSVKVEPTYARIDGPKSIVDSLSHIYTGAINIEGIYRSSEYEVSLINDNQFLKLNETQNVKVTVDLVQSQTSTTFSQVEVTSIGLPDNLYIANGPYSVSLNLSGTVLALERLSESQIMAIANCSSVTESGEYDIPIEITVPSGIQVDAQSIQSVHIVVESALEEINEELQENNSNESEEPAQNVPADEQVPVLTNP